MSRRLEKENSFVVFQDAIPAGRALIEPCHHFGIIGNYATSRFRVTRDADTRRDECFALISWLPANYGFKSWIHPAIPKRVYLTLLTFHLILVNQHGFNARQGHL